MIVERDGFVYIPVRAFARIAGVEPFMVTQYIATGVIHHTYVIHVDSYDGGKRWVLVREDKARALKDFLETWKSGVALLKIIKQWYKVEISAESFASMKTLGYIKDEWCKHLKTNADKGKSVMTWFCADEIQNIIKEYHRYRQERPEQTGRSCFGVYGDDGREPNNTILFRPNPECEGFILTPDQIERLKIIREYKEGKEPLF